MKEKMNFCQMNKKGRINTYLYAESSKYNLDQLLIKNYIPAHIDREEIFNKNNGWRICTVEIPRKYHSIMTDEIFPELYEINSNEDKSAHEEMCKVIGAIHDHF